MRQVPHLVEEGPRELLRAAGETGVNLALPPNRHEGEHPEIVVGVDRGLHQPATHDDPESRVESPVEQIPETGLWS